MTVLCPACWRVVSLHATICPHCGINITRHHQRPFREKLLAALTHPDRDTVIRAAGALAARHDPDAPHAIEHAIERYHSEPHVVAGLLHTLAMVDDANVERIARSALAHPSFIVRRAAAQLLEQKRERTCR